MPCVQVAQSIPVESLAMTSVSVWTFVRIEAGNPLSSEYVFVPLL